MRHGSPLVIRVDAAGGVGLGHLMRALALAQAWPDPADVTVFATAVPSECRSSVEQAGVVVIEVVDDKEFLDHLARRAPASVVLDGYRFSPALQTSVRALGCRLLVLDDFAQVGGYDADIVLDQSLGARDLAYRDRGYANISVLGTCLCAQRSDSSGAAAGPDQTVGCSCASEVRLTQSGWDGPERRFQARGSMPG